MKKTFFLFFMLLFAGIQVQAESLNVPVKIQNHLQSGYYGPFQIAVSEDQQSLEGVFYDAWGEEDPVTKHPKFSCKFVFVGKWNAASQVYDVEALDFDSKRSGQLKFSKDENALMKLAMIFDEDFETCPKGPTSFKAEKPTEHSLTVKKDWFGMGQVNADKAYFYDAPKLQTKRDAYVIKKDWVHITKIEMGWYEVEFISSKEGKSVSVKGWMPKLRVNRIATQF